MKSSLLVLLFAAAAPTAFAADSPMKPGLWEISVQMQMSGAPYQVPPRTLRQCITPQQLGANGGVPKPQMPPNSQCKMASFHHDGNTTDWSMVCSGQMQAHGEGSMTYDSATAYHGTMNMSMDMAGHQTVMKQSMSGKRIGDCSK